MFLSLVARGADHLNEVKFPIQSSHPELKTWSHHPGIERSPFSSNSLGSLIVPPPIYPLLFMLWLITVINNTSVVSAKHQGKRKGPLRRDPVIRRHTHLYGWQNARRANKKEATHNGATNFMIHLVILHYLPCTPMPHPSSETWMWNCLQWLVHCSFGSVPAENLGLFRPNRPILAAHFSIKSTFETVFARKRNPAESPSLPV